MAELKKIEGVYGKGAEYWVGDGFPVRNLFPSTGVSDAINPFLMLDYVGPTEVPASNQPKGVGEHPHRGFETVTIAYQGSVEHRDSAGHSGVIGPGDVQWMTAAAGIVHEEMHEREFTKAGGTFEMVQLWVNLPKAHKMSQPHYQGIVSGQIPHADLGSGAYARVIAGELNGVKGPARTFTPINVFDVRLNAGNQAVVNLPAGHHSAVVLLNGDVTVNGSRALKGEAMLAVFSAAGEQVSLAANGDSKLLIISGEPIDEPVAKYGPFVMNTQQELLQAFEDYKAGKMGRLSAASA